MKKEIAVSCSDCAFYHLHNCIKLPNAGTIGDVAKPFCRGDLYIPETLRNTAAMYPKLGEVIKEGLKSDWPSAIAPSVVDEIVLAHECLENSPENVGFNPYFSFSMNAARDGLVLNVDNGKVGNSLLEQSLTFFARVVKMRRERDLTKASAWKKFDDNSSFHYYNYWALFSWLRRLVEHQNALEKSFFAAWNKLKVFERDYIARGMFDVAAEGSAIEDALKGIFAGHVQLNFLALGKKVPWDDDVSVLVIPRELEYFHGIESVLNVFDIIRRYIRCCALNSLFANMVVESITKFPVEGFYHFDRKLTEFGKGCFELDVEDKELWERVIKLKAGLECVGSSPQLALAKRPVTAWWMFGRQTSAASNFTSLSYYYRLPTAFVDLNVGVRAGEFEIFDMPKFVQSTFNAKMLTNKVILQVSDLKMFGGI